MKKTLMYLLALTMSFAFVSCDDDDDKKSDNNGGTSQTGGNTQGGSSQTGDNTQGGGSQTGDNTQGGGSETTSAKVDDCKLNWFAESIKVGDSFTAYAQIHADGVTGKNGTHSGLSVQFGYIAINDFLAASNPGVDTINWVNASRNEGYDGDGSDTKDEYMTAGVVPSNAGTYGVGYRVSTDAGANWTYCGVNGIITDISTLATNVGFINVEDGSSSGSGSANVNISWCQVTWATDIKLGEVFNAYAQVYAEGVTGSSNSHEGIIGEIGYVPVQDYLKNGAQLKFGPAKRNTEFNADASANNDEYMPDGVKPEKADGHALVFRFSGDGGNNWIYCGKNGVITSMDNVGSEVWLMGVNE